MAVDQQLNILVQSSDYYAPFAGVMLTSLFENNQDIKCITVYLMTSDMSEKNRGRFQILAERYKRNIKFIDTKEIDCFLENNQAPRYHGAYTTYSKMFALSVIKDEIDRLIYLDSDIVINGSLSYLINADLNGMVLGMCIDCVRDRYKKIIQLNSKYYYNAGVIVFDLKKWLAEKWMDKVIYHITKIHASYPIVDQDILNLLLRGKIQTLPMVYNFNPVIFEFQDYDFFIKANGVKNYYSESEFIQAKKEPVILHCFGIFGIRPWCEGDHPAKEIWCKYLKMSPWSDYTFTKANPSFMQKIQGFLFKNTPKSFFVAANKIGMYILSKRQRKEFEGK